MTDVLIRGVPDDEPARIDRRASSLGLSRNEYLRRQLAIDAGPEQGEVSVDQFRKFVDLADDELMRSAWS